MDQKCSTQDGQAEADLLRSLFCDQRFQAVIFLVLLLQVFFFPFIWGSRTLSQSARAAPSILPGGAMGEGPPIRIQRSLDPGAPAWLLEPSMVFTRRALAKGQLPLWNPYIGYGTPFAASMQPQPYHPFAILAALFPTAGAYSVLLVARLLVAGFFTYLYLRFFVAHVPSLAGAVSFMFTGYFILHLNAPHLSVEVMLPALLYAFERFLRHAGARSIILCALVVFLTIVGGMPESTLLALTFACLYYAYRVLQDASLSKFPTLRVGRLAAVILLGFGLAAFLLVPFAEFVSVSFTSHTGEMTTGLQYDTGAYRSLLTYLVPLVHGPPLVNIVDGSGWSGILGYFGSIAVVFAILGVVALFRNGWQGRLSTPDSLVPFFLLTALFLILKRYGSVLVNWIGELPLFRMVVFYKYDEPLLGFCVAVLCAFGFAYATSPKFRIRSGALALGLTLGLLLTGYVMSLPLVLRRPQSNAIFFGSTVLALVMLLGIALALLAGTREASGTGFRPTPWYAWLLLACLASELFLCFIYPLFYWFSEQPEKRFSADSGAPYIAWLQQQGSDAFRIFARDGFLHPNWAEAFGLFDIRNLDAMYDRRYFPFLRAFLGEAKAPELLDRFTGTMSDYSFASPASKRVLQLSSVKYLIGAHSFGPDSLISQIVRLDRGVHVSEGPAWSIKGLTRWVMFQHPPSPPVGLKAPISAGGTELKFGIALSPDAYNGPCGDGIEFVVEIRAQNGAVRKVYQRFIDPFNRSEERKWFDETVDLRPFQDQEVEILFSTGPGPNGNNCDDWAGWGDIRLGPSEFNLVYDREAQIYEYRDVLPRAAVLYGAEVYETGERVLQRLVDPAHDVFTRAVLLSSRLSPEDVARVDRMNKSKPRRASAARIVRYEPQRVDIEAAPESPALLVLNDTDFPGWAAYVDGRPARILNANYLFRGVMLDGGRHTVSFRYEPSSLRLGMILSVMSALALGAWLALQAKSNSVSRGSRGTTG